MYKYHGPVNKKSGLNAPASNPSFLKTKALSVPIMIIRRRHITVVIAFALAGTILAGCSSINERLAPTVGEAIPQWAGGLPKDVPPRRGTPEYDAYMQERERKQFEYEVSLDVKPTINQEFGKGLF